MKNHSDKYSRHQDVARAQAHQQLRNCALLCAYVFGPAEGWYAIVAGNIDGFASDYAMVHFNAGDFECHPVRAVYLTSEEAAESFTVETTNELVRELATKRGEEEPALVATLTAEEIEAARLAVREAITEQNPEDAETWMENLCSGISALFGVDWASVVAEVKK